MKRCPQCRQIFNDEDVFCLNDGTTLEIVVAGNDTPTQIVSSPLFAPSKNGVTGNRFYLIIGLMAVLIVFLLGGVIFLLLRPWAVQIVAEMPANKPGNAQNTVPATKVESANANISSQPSLPPITSDAVSALIERWEKAQDAQNFRSYQDCYGQPFLDIKRTKTGAESQMNYGQWMNDRRKMLSQAVGLDIEVQGLSVAVDGDTATAEFEQYYRSVEYSDYGPKVLKIKMFPDGPKIVYEDLKASQPYKITVRNYAKMLPMRPTLF
jgi:hypothetical protein